jgi:signal peptidase I
VLVLGTAVLVAIVGLGAFAGARMPAWGELDETRAALAAAERDLTETRARLEEVRQERDAQRGIASELAARTANLEREIGQLQASLAISGPLTDQFTAMTEELATLRSAHDALLAAHDQLQAQRNTLVRIRTPELPGDALALDRSVPGVTYTSAICSGSMEPNISCDDLLVLYRPAITDLKVGDIVYFRRRSADCSAVLDGRYTLHRITAVTAGDEGVRYRTKGDALQHPDPCPVPAEDIVYKLLTNVRGGRID